MHFPDPLLNHWNNFQDEDHPRQIKAQPVPDFSTVFKPELAHQSTHSKPFSFDQRDKELKDKKEEKIKTIIDDEKKVGF